MKVGDPVPFFEGIDQNQQKITSKDMIGKKWILFFYPKDHTPGCTNQVCNLRDNYQTLMDLGYEIIGVSADSAKSHTRFIEKHQLPFSLIADTDKTIIEAFGIWGEKQFMGRKFMGIHRNTFIINEEGIVEHIIRKVKTKKHTDQILELIAPTT